MKSYDVKKQYKNADNLDSRIQLHEKFSTNLQDWHEWLFEQFESASGSHVLELGCGSGALWLKNQSRIPEDWEITLSDFSAGMLEDAMLNLAGINHNFAYKRIDIQAISYPDDSFDVVFANHMLYHVPDRAKAIAEIRRVLKPGGVLYASTIGKSNMKEIGELLADFDPEIRYGTFASQHATAFGLENGEEQLSQQFSQVERRKFECDLRVTEVEPLVAYILSTGSEAKEKLVGSRLAAFNDYLGEKIAADGAIHITKDAGFFAAE